VPAPADDAALADVRERLAAAEQNAAARAAERDQLRADLAEQRTILDQVTGELATARANETEARDHLAALTRKVGALRADYTAAADDNRALADQLAAITAERDQLAEQAELDIAHRCAWPWPDPDLPVQPCECGRPYPRYLEDVEDEEPERDVEPWEALFDRIRDEIQETGLISGDEGADLEPAVTDG
jgi:DNA repair exonuclease SbcCD ATPase subunit